MTDLPGNPHAKDAEFSTEALRDWMSNEGETDATMLAVVLDSQAQATLALAYEQRTANLIALITARWANDSAMFPGQIDEVCYQVLERLGKIHD